MQSKDKDRLNDPAMLELLKNPEVHAKIQELAGHLAKNVYSTSNILVDIAIGTRFQDIRTGKIWRYDTVAAPFIHDNITWLVLETAKQQPEEFKELTYIILQDVTSPRQGGKYIVSGRDFINYFAAGIWKLIDNIEHRDPEEFANKI